MWLYLIEVKVFAPKGYKPRTSTYKGCALSKHRNIADKLKEKALSIAENQLKESNPGVDLKLQATAFVQRNTFALNIDDELEGISTVKIPLDINKDAK